MSIQDYLRDLPKGKMVEHLPTLRAMEIVELITLPEDCGAWRDYKGHKYQDWKVDTVANERFRFLSFEFHRSSRFDGFFYIIKD